MLGPTGWRPNSHSSYICDRQFHGPKESVASCAHARAVGKCISTKPYWLAECPNACNVGILACDQYNPQHPDESPRMREFEWKKRPTRFDPDNCYEERLRSVVARDPGCLHHASYSTSNAVEMTIEDGWLRSSQLPIYVIHAPLLRDREASMRTQLIGLRAADVTWVHCINKRDVSEFSAEDWGCLHPCHAVSRYTKVANRTLQPMAHGTLSLALKHKLAYFDMLRRKLQAALVLEDDAIVDRPSTLWASIRMLPSDASIVYLGSYAGGAVTVDSIFFHPPVSTPHGLKLHRRNMSMTPRILGALAYVVSNAGARILHQPVLVPADLGISFSVHPQSFRNITVTASEVGSLHDMQCLHDGRPVRLEVPSSQYGLRSWFIRPNPSLAGGTHEKRE